MQEGRMVLRTCTFGVLLIALALFQTLQAADDIYSDGPLEVAQFEILKVFQLKNPTCRTVTTSPSPAGQDPPRRLFISFPKKSGQYPVIHLQHGFFMNNTFYGQLLQHLASHGFIVIAPQMDRWPSSDATEEIALAAAVLDWYPNNLAIAIRNLLPSVTVVPNLDKLVLVGHSRGGKVAFGLATGVCKSSVKYAAIAGFDPVDGSRNVITGAQESTPPPILTHTPGGLNLTFPTLIVGAGLEATCRCPISGIGCCLSVLQPCAPLLLSHDAFFGESKALAFHFVATRYGHMDYLDDEIGWEGASASRLCIQGSSREPMRRFSGGILVAFLQAVLFHDYTAISRALNPSLAPLELMVANVTGTFPGKSFDPVLLPPRVKDEL